MRQGRERFIGTLIAIVGAALVISTGWPTQAGQATSPGDRAASVSAPVVPETLVAPQAKKVAPPSVRPRLRPTPPPGPETFRGVLPEDIGVSLPALWCLGTGEVAIEGDVSVRLSGEGSLWVSQGSSVTLDLATTYTKKSEKGGWTYDNFRGTARINGPSVRLVIKGNLLYITAEGKGKATFTGQGTFRVTQTGRQLVSGLWQKTGITEQFEQVAVKAATPQTRPLGGRRIKPPAGLLPPAPPSDAKVYPPRKRLPSDSLTTGAVPSSRLTPTTPTARSARARP